jgi:hypothetical protein
MKKLAVIFAIPCLLLQAYVSKQELSREEALSKIKQDRKYQNIFSRTIDLALRPIIGQLHLPSFRPVFFAQPDR